MCNVEDCTLCQCYNTSNTFSSDNTSIFLIKEIVLHFVKYSLSGGDLTVLSQNLATSSYKVHLVCLAITTIQRLLSVVLRTIDVG